MTDAEIDALAREIFSEVVANVIAIAPHAGRILHNSEDQPFLELGGVSKEGLGTFRYHYEPIPPIKKLIAESERLYDGFEVTIKNAESGQIHTKQLKDLPGGDRNQIIREMAFVAALQMVGEIFPNLIQLIRDSFRDARMIAEGALISIIASSPDADDEALIYANTDMTDAIEEAVREISNRKRKILQDFLNGAPYVIASRNPGRKRKTVFQVKQEADQYSSAVEAAYRAERLAVGKKPTKISVATRLKEGGVDPTRGSDTRLNAFNLKLARYGINYEQIATKVEDELHNNSS